MMTKEFFNNLLKYHQNLVDPDFLRSVLNKINQRNKKRIHIILLFTLLGTFASVMTLLVLQPISAFNHLTNNFTTIGITCISLFLIWLIFEETQISD